MGWSASEDLICILEDGNVLLYDIYGSIQKTTSMGQVIYAICSSYIKILLYI